MKESATSIIKTRIPRILSRKSSEQGLTFNELWAQLERDKVASKYLKNKKNEWRYGLLQGISTRVKADKVSGITIIKTEDGSKWFSVDDKLSLKMTEFKRHLTVLSSIKFVEGKDDNVKLSNLDKKINGKVAELNNLTNEVTKLLKEEIIISQKDSVSTNKEIH